MLIDGEKWACEACVRGHRVSSCHHSDRPLTHINKKGRPVSQCVHCRGLRKSRTTHIKCECGDKKKNSHKNDSDAHAVDKRDPKQESRQRCGCTHGQRCNCALKKEHHLDPVPETGLPSFQPAVLSESKKSHPLTSTKSETTLTTFRDGHHKPAHKHNDMAHKCGLPYTIPRSHTFHSTSDVARRSVDHLPLTQTTIMGEDISQRVEHITNVAQRLVRSEHGSPESAPITALEDTTTPVPPLEPSSFVDSFPSAPPSQPLEQTNDGSPEHASVPNNLDSIPRDQILTSVPPLDVSLSSFPTTIPSPTACMAFQDPYQETYFASPDTEFPLSSAAFNAPSVDWSSFPLYSSDVPAAPSTQAPSYASFDYGSFNNAMPAPSSSGDLSELDEFGPIPGLGNGGSDLPDLNSVSEGSELDRLRFSSASALIGLPQTQHLSSSNLESLSIDDFLKSANESTAALEQQLQASMGMEPKSLSAQNTYAIPQPEIYKAVPIPIPMATSPTDPIWSAAVFDSMPTSDDENFFSNTWV